MSYHQYACLFKIVPIDINKKNKAKNQCLISISTFKKIIRSLDYWLFCYYSIKCMNYGLQIYYSCDAFMKCGLI